MKPIPLYLIAGLCLFIGVFAGVLRYLTPGDRVPTYQHATCWILGSIAALLTASLMSSLP
jgi:cytochrome c oxidase assembly factor CtaG